MALDGKKNAMNKGIGLRDSDRGYLRGDFARLRYLSLNLNLSSLTLISTVRIIKRGG